jgi:hypothetical protein
LNHLRKNGQYGAEHYSQRSTPWLSRCKNQIKKSMKLYLGIIAAIILGVAGQAQAKGVTIGLIGRAASMAYNFKEGDRTHFNKVTAQAITDLILPELIKVAP